MEYQKQIIVESFLYISDRKDKNMTVFEAASEKVSTNELPMMVNENCIEWLKGDTVATVSLC